MSKIYQSFFILKCFIYELSRMLTDTTHSAISIQYFYNTIYNTLYNIYTIDSTIPIKYTVQYLYNTLYVSITIHYKLLIEYTLQYLYKKLHNTSTIYRQYILLSSDRKNFDFLNLLLLYTLSFLGVGYHGPAQFPLLCRSE